MRRISEQVMLPAYDRNSWRLYTDGLSAAVFDIETTGLSSSRDALILGGVLNAGEPGSLRQYLASSRREEPELLAAYMEDLSAADIWISYNGDTFDRPFLAQRLFKNGMGSALPLHQSVDLYRLFRRYSPMARLLPDLKQTTVEEALGLADHRRDVITGRESAALYADYVRTEDPDLERRILLHNHDDLLMLSRLIRVLDKMDLHRIMFRRGFMTGWENRRALAEKITLGKNFVRLEGHTRNVEGDYDIFSDAFHWSHRKDDGSFSLTIHCIYEKNATFVDLESFDVDFGPLMVYPCFINGYLLLHDGRTAYCREINHLAKLVLQKLLSRC